MKDIFEGYSSLSILKQKFQCLESKGLNQADVYIYTVYTPLILTWLQATQLCFNKCEQNCIFLACLTGLKVYVVFIWVSLWWLMLSSQIKRVILIYLGQPATSSLKCHSSQLTF